MQKHSLKSFLLFNRRWLSEAIHLALAGAALWSSFALRFEFHLDPLPRHMLWTGLPLLLITKLVAFRVSGLRDLAWRYTGFRDLMRIAASCFGASLAAGVILRLAEGLAFPRSIPILDFVLSLALVAGAHALAQIVYEWRTAAGYGYAKRVAVYGAGKAGRTLVSEIRANPQIGYEVMGFFDDAPAKLGLRLHGVKVLGGRQALQGQVKARRIELILVALPQIPGGEMTRILEECHRARVEAKRIPALADRIEDKVLVEQIREVRLEDLLGRPQVELEEPAIRARITGSVVLVTGAGGSIGSELCRQIARFSPRAIIGFDQAETALYQIDQELRTSWPGLAFYPEIGSIQSRRRLEEVFREHRPQAVYHAAAYKHVPLMEAHLFEAVENNVFGTENVVWAAGEFGASEVVLVSSDKAVRPSSVMGATKRLAELVGMEAGAASIHTRFVAVRFGNVLGSSGSVIPLFQRQIAAGGPVTVTHPDMRRFFMTIPEAAQLVLQAAAMGKGGEIFVLNMGEPVKIVDLASKLVLLSGLKPGMDIAIEFTGIRPGEKLYEELSAYEEDTVATPHSKIRIFAGPKVTRPAIRIALYHLRMAAKAGYARGVVLALKELIPDYNPSGHLLRKTFQESAGEVAAAQVAGR
jgi:FlaA1/EpsC-like NDP-sugar epimerase